MDTIYQRSENAVAVLRMGNVDGDKISCNSREIKLVQRI
jgi:hypothetical protein